VLIDGGPSTGTFGRLLDSYNLNGATFDVVILTHQHADHYQGLRELFRTSRHITIGRFFENEDAGLSSSLIELRDSIRARVRRGELSLVDTDDPCGNGASVCAVVLDGGARLELLRPDPRGDKPNNRSVAVKLIAPDSAAFAMWLAGDAERSEIAYFDSVDYDVRPGMHATVLKANHHGSCNGITGRYLDLIQPEVVIMSLSERNTFGFVHQQTLDVLRERGIPWYRTDVNGTITIRAGSGARRFTVTTERGSPSESGIQDRLATQTDCRAM